MTDTPGLDSYYDRMFEVWNEENNEDEYDDYVRETWLAMAEDDGEDCL